MDFQPLPPLRIFMTRAASTKKTVWQHPCSLGRHGNEMGFPGFAVKYNLARGTSWDERGGPYAMHNETDCACVRHTRFMRRLASNTGHAGEEREVSAEVGARAASSANRSRRLVVLVVRRRRGASLHHLIDWTSPSLPFAISFPPTDTPTRHCVSVRRSTS